MSTTSAPCRGARGQTRSCYAIWRPVLCRARRTASRKQAVSASSHLRVGALSLGCRSVHSSLLCASVFRRWCSDTDSPVEWYGLLDEPAALEVALFGLPVHTLGVQFLRVSERSCRCFFYLVCACFLRAQMALCTGRARSFFCCMVVLLEARGAHERSRQDQLGRASEGGAAGGA